MVRPKTDQPDPPVIDSEPPTSDVGRRRCCVLVVDDEALIRAALRRAIGRHHDVVDTADGREALAWIAGGAEFDAILCDYLMPVMTGAAFYDALVLLRPDLGARVGFLTAARDHHVEAFFARAQRPHLDKPFQPTELHDFLAALFPQVPPSHAPGPVEPAGPVEPGDQPRVG